MQSPYYYQSFWNTAHYTKESLAPDTEVIPSFAFLISPEIGRVTVLFYMLLSTTKKTQPSVTVMTAKGGYRPLFQYLTRIQAKFVWRTDEGCVTLMTQIMTCSWSAGLCSLLTQSDTSMWSRGYICRQVMSKIISGFPSAPVSWSTRKLLVCLKINWCSTTLPQLLVIGWTMPLVASQTCAKIWKSRKVVKMN